MRMHAVNDARRGQILLIVAAGLVVLMAVAALVIDLGFSWMLRRQEQNATDPAAIAAARWLKNDVGVARSPFPEANWDACFYARENGFFPSATTNDLSSTGCVPANDPRGSQLQVHWPPASGPYAGQPGKVQVVITSTHPSFFAQIFGRDFARVTTGAVGANDAGNSNSSSLVALQSTCSAGSAGDVDGGGEVRIFPTDPNAIGGYVHVNSPCGNSTDDACNNGTGSAALSISGTLTTPFAYVNGSCTYNGSDPDEGLQCDPPTVTCLDEGALPLGDPLANVPEPRTTNFPNGICPNGTPSTPTSTSGCDLKKSSYCPPDTVDPSIDICTLTPGVYYGGWQIGSKVALKLQPGMYILAGGGISLSGGDASIEAVTSATGVDARIMIFSTDGPGCPSIGAQCQGEIRFQASQAFRAKALNAATCGLVSPQACPWKGILLWQDGTASNPGAVVHIGGQASTILAGTIYAPLAQVEVSGGSATTGCVSGPTAGCLAIQIISYRWKITGGGLVEMPYDPAELYQLDLRGLVH
jgi:Flp pilus assembly protein TadG